MQKENQTEPAPRRQLDLQEIARIIAIADAAVIEAAQDAPLRA